MTQSIDPPIRSGDAVFAAVVETRRSSAAVGGTIIGNADKRPVAVLVWKDEHVTGIDLSGKLMSADELERRFPRMSDQFVRMAKSTP